MDSFETTSTHDIVKDGLYASKFIVLGLHGFDARRPCVKCVCSGETTFLNGSCLLLNFNDFMSHLSSEKRERERERER